MTNEEYTNPENNEEPRSAFEEFLYHQRRALEETGKALEALLPEGFRVHGNNASKEFTKGFRVLVDAAIDELKTATASAKKTVNVEGDEGDKPRPASTGKTKVKVEVD